ncbi:MAG: hypothetical protein ACXADF_14880, partial [Candidatus Thorarchaeota archaeon]
MILDEWDAKEALEMLGGRFKKHDGHLTIHDLDEPLAVFAERFIMGPLRDGNQSYPHELRNVPQAEDVTPARVLALCEQLGLTYA